MSLAIDNYIMRNHEGVISCLGNELGRHMCMSKIVYWALPATLRALWTDVSLTLFFNPDQKAESSL